MAKLVWMLAAVALLGVQSTDAYLCMCSPNSCVLIHPNTEFFNSAESFCSTMRSAAHDISIIKLLDTQLTPVAFSKFPNMTSLEIFQGQLAHLNPDTFASAGKLTKLLIRGNSLTSLEDFTFKGADNLRDLLISANPLNTIAENAFANLKHLEILVLAHGEIMTLPKGVFKNNRRLKMISMNSNKLTSLDPEVLDGLDELTKLELADNQLKAFDFKFLKAAVIVLSNNSLEHLVVNEHCSAVYASNNKLKSFDINGASLTKLSVINNEISDISNITKLVNLTSLSLGSNNLNPNTVFSSLTSLEELMLQSTFINLTEDTFDGLTKLRILDLSYNNYTEADFKIFKSQMSLQVLSYIGNRIKVFNYIEVKEFLPRLRVLEICKNGWNATYFETNVLRMRRFSLSPDVHGFSSHFLFRQDYIDMCTEQIIVSNYDDYEEYPEQPIDVEDEIRAVYPKESTTTSTTTTTTTTTTTPPPPPSTTTTATTTTTQAPGSAVPTTTAGGHTTTTTTKTNPKDHHVSEYNSNITYAQTEQVQAASSPAFVTFQVLVYILSVVGLGALVAVAYLWKKRQLDFGRNVASAESTDSVRLL